MNKKLNSLLFILIATVVNIILCFTLLVVFVLIVMQISSELVRNYMFLVAFVAAIVGSSFLYRKIANWAFERFNLSDKLDPLFKPRSHKRINTNDY